MFAPLPAPKAIALVALLCAACAQAFPACAQSATEVPPSSGFTPAPLPPSEYPDELKERLARPEPAPAPAPPRPPGTAVPPPPATPADARSRRLASLARTVELPPADFAETRRVLANLERERAVEIARTFDPNSRDVAGRTLLHLYVKHAAKDALAALLASGADPDVKDETTGATPLTLACERDDLEAVTLLLSYGADPNLKDDAGRTPLSHARERGHPAIASELLSAGARGEGAPPAPAASPAKAVPEETAFAPGAAHGPDYRPRPVTPLLAGFKPGVDFADVEEAIAAREVDRLVRIARDADPESRDAKGRRLLHHLLRAAHATGPEPLLALLLAGADLEAVEGGSGATPLTLAAAQGAAEAVNLLVARGADVNRRDEAGRTPLDAARRHGFDAIAAALLAAGAHDPRGVAAAAGPASGPAPGGVAIPPPPKLVELPQTDSKPVADFDELKRALDAKDRAKLVEFAKTCDPDARDPEGRRMIHLFAGAGQTDALRELLAAGADPDALDESTGRSALAVACERGDAASVELLAGRGARLDAFGEDGLTPLMHAAVNGRVEVARKLLEAGARPDAANDGGANALLFASGGTGVDAAAIVELLLEKGVDANAKDASGDSPLKRARKAGNAKVVEALVAAGAKDEPEETKPAGDPGSGEAAPK